MTSNHPEPIDAVDQYARDIQRASDDPEVLELAENIRESIRRGYEQ